MRSTLTIPTLALSATLALSTGAFAAAKKADQKVAIDPASSSLKWEGTKVTGKHEGTIQLKDGELLLDSSKKELRGGNLTIDMTSIVDRDLQDPADKTKLETHLKSEDFFDVAKYPTAVLKIKDVRSVPGFVGPTFEVTGDLTIKGKTNEVKFPAIVETKDGKTTAKANITIDRTRWDVRYGSGKFFPGLGDKLIHDNFKLDIALASK